MCYSMIHEVKLDGSIIHSENDNKLKGGYIFNEIILQRFHPQVTFFRKEVL